MQLDQALDPATVLWVTVTAVGVVVAIAWGWRPPSRTEVGHRGLQQLKMVSMRLLGQLDEDAILRCAVIEGRRMFGCSSIEAVLYPHDGEGGKVAGARSRPHGDAPLVRSTATGAPAPQPSSTLLVGRLLIGNTIVGHVSVHFRRPLRRRRQQQLFGAFVSVLAGSLGAARAYQAQRRETEARANEARHDPLTGLGNRNQLAAHGPSLLAESAAQGNTVALFLLDLDGFKRINDTFGHAAGDHVLEEVGRRIRAVLRETDIAVRLGGDEFAAMVRVKAPADVDPLAERLLQALRSGVQIEEIVLGIQASFGIAVHGIDGDTVESLLSAADAAMYEVKRNGRGHWRRSGRHEACRPEGETLRAADLRRALHNGELVVHFQPQVAAETGEVAGFEALARWQHPELGLLQPLDFVPFAERVGLMRELTLAVIGRAVAGHRELRRWARDSHMAVNVSARTLLGQDLADEVRTRLEVHRAPAERLTIEITEPAADYSASIGSALTGLQRLGCRVSIHDFGSGQTSLASLSRHDVVGEVKVAASLAGRVLVDPGAERMVRAMATMVRGLGLRVVAEGVESAQLAHALRELGCDVLQGYHVQGPATLADTLAWLADWPRVRAERLGLSPAVGKYAG